MTDNIIKNGSPLPLGASLCKDGVNFSIYSKDATKVVLYLFEKENSKTYYKSYELNPEENKTGDIWHIFLPELKAGCLYLYKVDGPYNPPKGLRFNFHKYLFDPYAKAFTQGSVFRSYNKQHKNGFSSNNGGELKDLSDFPKCVVVDDDFDWEGDKPLNYPLEETIIYETHLKGFTASPTSGVKKEIAGTYKAFPEKVEHLKKLGVTSVELLPVFEFDENENPNSNPRTGNALINYWGYSTIGFFAPKTTYSADKKPGASVNEFKQMVKELHKAGIEVILDVVYNHTAEGNEHGYTFEFRGLQNDVYYSLPQNDAQYYMNYSGCGNSVNCNHPVTHSFILDSLRYWVLQMHVDGFRFDLASVLCRDEKGFPLAEPPLTRRISQDPVLSHTKIIAEPWDCGGHYLVGGFPGGRWCEWNDKFRDGMRKFIRGDEHLSTEAATRIAGSSDLYSASGRRPVNSINYIVSHDGFTLADLVAYNSKHNEQNGEENRDGTDNNLSWNYGFEGDTENPKIEKLRIRQIKNFFTALFVSQGVPMFVAGDEVRRSQGGNNNAYCQDNKISWFNWDNVKTNQALFTFVKNLIAMRKSHRVLTRTKFFTGAGSDISPADISWFGADTKLTDWTKASRFLAFRLGGGAGNEKLEEDSDFYIAFNTDIHDKTITIPPPTVGRKWYRVVDTSIEDDTCALTAGNEELLNNQEKYVIVSNSAIVLMSS